MAAPKIKFNRSALIDLMQNEDLVSGRAEAVADACNNESSWGGYEFEVSVSSIRARGIVWCVNSTPNRANRMIRNLDAGG